MVRTHHQTPHLLVVSHRSRTLCRPALYAPTGGRRRTPAPEQNPIRLASGALCGTLRPTRSPRLSDDAFMRYACVPSRRGHKKHKIRTALTRRTGARRNSPEASDGFASFVCVWCTYVPFEMHVFTLPVLPKLVFVGSITVYWWVFVLYRFLCSFFNSQTVEKAVEIHILRSVHEFDSNKV